MDSPQRTHSEHWDLSEEFLSPAVMDQRIRNTLRHLGWKYLLGYWGERGIVPEKASVVEIGCGSGTFSLTLALMGAAVTLIDCNPQVLDLAGRIYRLYGVSPRLLHSDCLEPPPPELAERYDLACSLGVAEHFTGDYRRRCIQYHRDILKPGGVVYISVPNAWSPCYQMIRVLRTLTGTWDLDVEVPYSIRELLGIAQDLGLVEFRVVGNLGLLKDVHLHGRGLISAVVDLLPRRCAGFLRSSKRALVRSQASESGPNLENIRELCRISAMDARRQWEPARSLRPRDVLSAGIILFGHRGHGA